MADSLITGYAALFNVEAIIGGEWREKIAPGAFTRSLLDNDIVALLAHNSGRVLGRMSANTLSLREDSKGLHFLLKADETTPSGQEALGTVRRQDVKGCSFGFRVRSERWEDGGNMLPLRILEEVDMHEITLTAIPAWEATSASIYSGGMLGASRQRADEAMRRRGLEA